MMQALMNNVRMQALMASGIKTTVRIGTIDTYDHANYCARVIIQPEGSRTGLLPIVAPWSGNGWGMFCPPTAGDVVEVHFQEGDIEAGFICGRFYNNISRPLDVPSGEFWLVHKTGAFFKLTNDGKVTATDKAGSTIVMNGDGTGAANFSGGLTLNANVQINGNLIASGSISDQNGAKGTVQHIRDNYDVHTHPGIQPGSGNTGTPSTPL